jgi:hypothetical protein
MDQLDQPTQNNILHWYTEILKDQYPWAKEEDDENVPEALIDEIAITCFVDSDHSHDKTLNNWFGHIPRPHHRRVSQITSNAPDKYFPMQRVHF